MCKIFTLTDHSGNEMGFYDKYCQGASIDAELRELLYTKCYPETDLFTIDSAIEYNLFVSVPPDTVKFIELR